MHIKLRIWFLLITGLMLLAGASLVRGAPHSVETACADAAPHGGDIASPPVAANIAGVEAQALLQGADEACLDCHSDKERVQALAVEEETTESLNEGPG